ncbi:hypothetical protein DCAR_0520942 [Daucus carota subsp. sativus]|uniref:Uncharacterized protein n=1 Tax=Daucus carota subsp. sativus TaxID=79200 RepID=A0A161YMU9_DAUCS|nr:PREDICTED: uncharacterized protein LOC108220628 [Daucus carota subsp. sativus]WOH01558.1 hypothetical protein DCAR_0520942 [Daucus carota subsp. sativus]
MPPPSPSLEKKHWWLSNRKIADGYVRDARFLIATQEQIQVERAVNLLDSALTLSPQNESALELKARSLLILGRFKETADMLQDHIPSLKMSSTHDSSSSSSSSSPSLDNSSHNCLRGGVKLLSYGDSPNRSEPRCKYFSITGLKTKVTAGLGKNCEKEGQWRYLVLGQACCRLGLMEDALVLLQTGKRLATAASRRESICFSDDSFSLFKFPISGKVVVDNHSPSPAKSESEIINQLLSHIKFLCWRKTSALAALDAGLYAEAIRHFSKLLESRRGAPQGFLAECYTHRASAYRCAGRVAESLADCNRALALDPSCIDALSTRAALFETTRCLTDSIYDLEHLKLLYNTILRDRKLPGSAWKHQYVHYREIPGKLVTLATKIQALKQRVASGETGNVDYYALIGLVRGCSRSELERAHVLLTLRHKPHISNAFIDRCEFADNGEVDSVRERAKVSSFSLYRLIQKGYTNVMRTILDEEAVEEQRKKASASLQAEMQQLQQAQQEQVKHRQESNNGVSAGQHVQQEQVQYKPKSNSAVSAVQQVHQAQKEKFKHQQESNNAVGTSTVSPRLDFNRLENNAASMFQGVFCRDIVAAGSLLPQTGFNLPIAVKYEALSC